jgi:hypothetical protein
VECALRWRLELAGAAPAAVPPRRGSGGARAVAAAPLYDPLMLRLWLQLTRLRQQHATPPLPPWHAYIVVTVRPAHTALARCVAGWRRRGSGTLFSRRWQVLRCSREATRQRARGSGARVPGAISLLAAAAVALSLKVNLTHRSLHASCLNRSLDRLCGVVAGCLFLRHNAAPLYSVVLHARGA